jgi:uncharacterized membrane protein YeiH
MPLHIASIQDSLGLFNLSVEIFATLAFAASGLIAASRKRLDVFGVCMVTGVAAFGGGTLRDVLLDKRPFFWVQQSGWVWVILVFCLTAMTLTRSHHRELTEKAIQIPDAFGLGLFSALGTLNAALAGMPPIVAVLMGIVTAVFGGVLRDLLCNELPKAFADHKPYAALAFIGGWVVLALRALGLADWICLFIAAALTTLLRLLAIRLDWRLPGWRNPSE